MPGHRPKVKHASPFRLRTVVWHPSGQAAGMTPTEPPTRPQAPLPLILVVCLAASVALDLTASRCSGLSVFGLARPCCSAKALRGRGRSVHAAATAGARAAAPEV